MAREWFAAAAGGQMTRVRPLPTERELLVPQSIARRIAHRAVQLALLAAGITTIFLVFSRQGQAASSPLSAVAPTALTASPGTMKPTATSTSTTTASAVTSAITSAGAAVTSASTPKPGPAVTSATATPTTTAITAKPTT